jgi:hypothetical protein
MRHAGDRGHMSRLHSLSYGEAVTTPRRRTRSRPQRTSL